METTDIAWLAGLFEGEGNIYLASSGSIQVAIGMTDFDVIEKVDSLWQGKRYVAKRVGNKTLYSWKLYGKNGVEFLTTILPYLGERRTAKVYEALAAWNNPTKPRNKKQAYLSKMRELISQGFTHKQIANELGITASYVSFLRKEV